MLPDRPPATGTLVADAAVLLRVHRLWDELSGFSASDVETALRHLLQSTANLVDAAQAFWLGGVRLGPEADALSGWRVRAVFRIGGLVPNPRALKAIQAFHDRRDIDPITLAQVREAGSFRVRLLSELAPPGFSTTPAYQVLYERRDITDAIFAACPINEDVEAYLGFYRIAQPARPFTEFERDLIGYTLRPLRWLQLRVLLHHGVLVATAPLTETERRLVGLLMSDRSEKQIATELGLTFHTTHTYVKTLFRKFGVSGRPGLTALWLGTPPAAPSSATAGSNAVDRRRLQPAPGVVEP